MTLFDLRKNFGASQLEILPSGFSSVAALAPSPQQQAASLQPRLMAPQLFSLHTPFRALFIAPNEGNCQIDVPVGAKQMLTRN
jgi:hypothetical protein